MGDMELDAMDHGSADFADDSYESDSGSEDSRDALSSSQSEVDQVAALLSGENVDVPESKANKSGFRTHNVDGHGNVSYSDDKPSREPVQKESAYGISGINTQSAIDTAQRELNNAHSAYEKLTAMYKAGEIDDSTYSHYSTVAGQHAGIHQRQLLENQILQRDHADQQRAAYDYLESEFPGKFTPEARTETLNSIVDWMTGPEIGLSADYLRDVEDPAILRIAMKSMTAIQNDQSQRDTIASQAAQIRRLKKARGEGRSQGRRSAQLGDRRGQQSVVDEVAAILSSNGGKS